MTGYRTMSRRTALAGAAALAMPAVARAQQEPLRLGVLTPLTGAGGFDGPRMLRAMQAVRAEINAVGGVLGRQIEFAVEDDQTNPEGAVRAARKLIEVDRVPVIMGTWASAVTAAVAPVCWESKTFLTTVSGADSITLLPHQGYLIRTQPNTKLQNGKHAEFIASIGAKRVFIMAVQAPFAAPGQARVKEVLEQNGSELAGGLIEHHGVAAGDALHQRIAKRRRFGKQGRQTRLDAGLIHQAGAATVQCRPIRRDGLQPG